MKSGSPATKPDLKPGQARALGERLECHDIGEAPGFGEGRLERPGRRRVAIDLRIAFVGEQQKVVAPCERDGAREIVAVGDRALRVRRRAEIEGDGALEQRLRRSHRASGRKPLAAVLARKMRLGA